MEWKTLESKIDYFSSLINDGFSFMPTDWKRVWTTAKEIQEGFRGIRFPTHEQHQVAWERFNKLRDEASSRSKREQDERRWKSERLKNEILSEVESARPNSLFGFSPVDIDDMKAYGAKLKSAGRSLSTNKTKMLGEHKQECFQAITQMRDVHDAWWDSLKKNRTQQQGDWRHRVRQNIEKNKERYRKVSEALKRQHNHAADLRSKISSAWNDDWVRQAEGWLSEAEDKIRDMEDTLLQIQSWIEEDERKL